MVLAITATLQGMSVKLRDAEGATLLQKAWGTEQEMPVNVLAFLFCLTLQLNFPRPWVLLQDICLFLVLSFPTPRVDSVLEIYISSSQLVSGQAHAFWDVEMRAETHAITSLSKSPRQICFQMLSFGFSPSSCIYINLVFLFMQRSGCTWRNEYRSAGIPKRRWRWGNTQRADSNPETHHREGRQLECQGQTWWYSFKHSQSRVQ